MIKRYRLVLLLAVISLCATPAAAQNGGELGACVLLGVGLGRLDQIAGIHFEAEGRQTFDLCIDAATEPECDTFCFLERETPESDYEACFWAAEELCTEQAVDWQGACQTPELCVLISSDDPGASAQLCFGGTTPPWFPGATDCSGVPVPVLSRVGVAALALLLLAGSLSLLTIGVDTGGGRGSREGRVRR